MFNLSPTKLFLLTIAGCVIGVVVLFGAGGGQSADRASVTTDTAEYQIAPEDFVTSTIVARNVPESRELQQLEEAGILLMREEEKMARDLYIMLGNHWDLRIFKNIAASEQTHMDVMGTLLAAYGLEDPVGMNDIGEFTNPDLQAQYDDWLALGKTSELQALVVGAMVEDLDIADLAQLQAETDQVDIDTVYERLKQASGNHLRAFERQITRRGGYYVPQYISREAYQAILSGQPVPMQ